MIIGGLQKFSLLDYPDHIAAIIFTQGCNFRCQFCYNPMLVWPKVEGKFNNNSAVLAAGDEKGYSPLSENGLFYFLEERKNKLDSVVITGGEPTIHPDLPEFIAKIRILGYKVKLDTNGTNPEMIAELIEKKLVDYIAMDIKTALSKYDFITGAQPDLDKIKSSIMAIKESGLPYEFRTTIVPKLHGPEDIEQIGGLISGAEKWYLQYFKNDIDLINDSFRQVSAYTGKQMEKMRKIGDKYVKKCEIR